MENKSGVSYNKNIKCADVHTESAAEYILPDYLGDVRKILFTSAAVRPAGRFMGGDRAECSGIVVYNMIYLDAEDNLSSAEFTSDYDYTVKCPCESCRDMQADTRVSGYSIRLSGPRKISAKASVVGSVRMSCDEEISLGGDCAEGREDLETSTSRLNIRHTEQSGAVEREYAESLIKLDSAIAEEVSVVYCDAKAVVESAECCDSAVSLKGKLRMSAVIKNGEAGAFLSEKVVNFEESVPFEKVDSEMKLIPETVVTSLKPSVNATEEGCEVVLSGIVELSVSGEKNDVCEVITDGYLKSCESECSYGELCYCEMVDVISAKGSHSATIPRAEIETGRLREVVFLTAEPKVDSISCEGDGVKIVGEVKYSGVASELDEEGSISYVMLKFSSPFDTNVNVSCQNPEKTRFELKVNAHSAGASIDSDNLYASCVLDCSLTVCEEKEERILASMNAKEDEAYSKEGAKITVYYPTAEDTLFSVAKRFHTSAVKVASDNSLTESVMSRENSEGSLQGVKKLLIY